MPPRSAPRITDGHHQFTYTPQTYKARQQHPNLASRRIMNWTRFSQPAPNEHAVRKTHVNHVRLLLSAVAGFAQLAALVTAANAHDFTLTQTRIFFEAGRYRIDLTCDLDALALGVPPQRDSAANVADLKALSAAEFDERVAKLRAYFGRHVRVEFDGARAEFDVQFPEHQGLPSEHTENPSVLGVTARLAGTVPHGASEFTFWLSRAFPPAHVSIRRAGSDVEVTHVLGPADPCPAYSLSTAPPRPASAWAVAAEYLRLGFEHILPAGLDHVLFVLGLFLLSPRLRPLLWQVTAFTIAHTITLALSMYNVVSLPASIVEPLIALSIAYVAIENLATTKLHPWRPAIVFAFGLLHGLGFAGVLRELGLPAGQYATALISFNVGVELGQLAVIGLALLAVGWARSAAGYRRWVILPGSTAVAGFGLYWTIARIFSA